MGDRSTNKTVLAGQTYLTYVESGQKTRLIELDKSLDRIEIGLGLLGVHYWRKGTLHLYFGPTLPADGDFYWILGYAIRQNGNYHSARIFCPKEDQK